MVACYIINSSIPCGLNFINLNLFKIKELPCFIIMPGYFNYLSHFIFPILFPSVYFPNSGYNFTSKRRFLLSINFSCYRKSKYLILMLLQEIYKLILLIKIPAGFSLRNLLFLIILLIGCHVVVVEVDRAQDYLRLRHLRPLSLTIHYCSMILLQMHSFCFR